MPELLSKSNDEKEVLLLAPVGLSPQVITETVFSLLRGQSQAVGRIVVAGTTHGIEKTREMLVTRGVLDELRRDLGLPQGAAALADEDLVLFRGLDGQPLEDIRTREDNEACANQLAALVQRLASGEAPLVGSVAGGRKTMSALLALAFSLHARPGDRLLHVLVSPPALESSSFFYPRPGQRSYLVRQPDGRRVRVMARDVRVELAELPFVRLRGLLGTDALEAGLSFRDLVARSQAALGALDPEASLELDERGRNARVAQAVVSLAPQEYALYAWLARRKLQDCTENHRATCAGCRECWPERTGELLDLAAAIMPGIAAVDEQIRRLDQIRSKVNRRLRSALGGRVRAAPFLIETDGVYGSKRWGLLVEREKIRIRGEAASLPKGSRS